MREEMGSRIRRARTNKGLTQAELSSLIGVEGSTVRHYELGRRSPSDALLGELANALDVAPESLRNLTPDSEREVLELLFRLEDECGSRPIMVPGECPAVAFDNASPKLTKMVAAWIEKLGELESGKITREEYAEWKMRYLG